MTGQMYPCRCVLSLELPIGVPQVSILGPDLFTALFADKVTATTAICQQWIWAGSLTTEYISGSPPLSPSDRTRCRKQVITLI